MDLPIISIFVSSFCWFVFFNCNKCIDKQLNWKRTTQFDIVDMCYVTLSILHTSRCTGACIDAHKHTHTHTFMDIDHRTSPACCMHEPFFFSHLVFSTVCDASQFMWLNYSVEENYSHSKPEYTIQFSSQAASMHLCCPRRTHSTKHSIIILKWN